MSRTFIEAIQRLGRGLFPKPRIFISYARENAELATSLFERLEESGFDVYLDKEKTLPGERFVPIIVSHLRRCDALLAILSEQSTASEWCQAELYYAHALRRTVVPVRIDEHSTLDMPEPLALVQNETQYISVSNGGENVLNAIEKRFRVVRRRSYRRWTQRCLLIIIVIGLLAWGLHSGFSMLLRAYDRAALLSRIDRSQEALNKDALELIVQKFKGDEMLYSSLLVRAADRERSICARLNARIVSAELGSREKRWYLESLSWSNSRFGNAELNEVTFRTGSINAVQFSDVSFGGVFWNEGPDFSMGGSSFTRCRFYGGEFARTNVIDCDFIDCRFVGLTLDISAFGAVRFVSRPDDLESTIMTDGTVTSFENVVIVNCVEPPQAGTMDFRGPGNEVKFSKVVFDSCRFRGFVRTEWFAECSFNLCIFPKSMSLQELEKGKNHVVKSSQLDESCP